MEFFEWVGRFIDQNVLGVTRNSSSYTLACKQVKQEVETTYNRAFSTPQFSFIKTLRDI